MKMTDEHTDVHHQQLYQTGEGDQEIHYPTDFMTRPFKQLAMNFVNSSILCCHAIDPFRFSFWSNRLTGDVSI